MESKLLKKSEMHTAKGEGGKERLDAINASREAVEGKQEGGLVVLNADLYCSICGSSSMLILGNGLK